MTCETCFFMFFQDHIVIGCFSKGVDLSYEFATSALGGNDMVQSQVQH